MNRVRVLGFLAGALALVALALPGSALAGTYAWDLANDFAAAPGANPDNDQYGGTPWSYEESATGSTDPSTFSLASLTFSASGGLSMWSDTSDGTVVGDNPTGAPITDVNVNATIEPGIFLEPGSGGQVAAVGWTSPFSQTVTVSINGAVSAEAGVTPPCTYDTTWTLEEEENAVLTLLGTSGLSAGASAPLPASATVAPGGAIYLAVANLGDPSCDATGLSLTIQANGTAPTPSVTSPAPGSSTTLTSPSFSGAAAAGFGDGSQVTLRVYSGPAASGNPVQSVTVARAGTGWSGTLASALPLGTYTVQAEQDDVVGDVGLSAPVTFTVRLPSVALASLGSRPQTTSTPTLTGTADAGAGAGAYAVVQVYAGTAASGEPIRSLTTAVTAAGQFAVPVAPALPDGTYTAMASQADASGNTGFSGPQTFSVDTHAPAVTLVKPAKGSRADTYQLVFAGAAGDQTFDSGIVTVALFKGKGAAAKAVGTMQTKVTGSSWSATWTKTLPPGVYTALAWQADVVGHVGLSIPHSFTVLPPPPVIGRVATINRAGRVSVKISCNEPADDTCSGTVLVLTRGEFQPVAGGPTGRLTVMFAYVHIRGGQTSTVMRTVLTRVADALRGHAEVAVTISANLRPGTGKAIHSTTRDNLRRIRG